MMTVETTTREDAAMHRRRRCSARRRINQGLRPASIFAHVPPQSVPAIPESELERACRIARRLRRGAGEEDMIRAKLCGFRRTRPDDARDVLDPGLAAAVIAVWREFSGRCPFTGETLCLDKGDPDAHSRTAVAFARIVPRRVGGRMVAGNVVPVARRVAQACGWGTRMLLAMCREAAAFAEFRATRGDSDVGGACSEWRSRRWPTSADVGAFAAEIGIPAPASWPVDPSIIRDRFAVHLGRGDAERGYGDACREMYERQAGICASTGVPMWLAPGEMGMATLPTPDRIDNSRPHVANNTVLCTAWANAARGGSQDPDVVSKLAADVVAALAAPKTIHRRLELSQVLSAAVHGLTVPLY